HRNTLQQFMVSAWAPVVPRALHRLDANTTGVVAFATTRHFAKLMQRQFLEGTVEKCYLARIKGHPKEDQFSCDAAISAAPGAHGRREIAGDDSLAAHTRFRVIQRRDDGSSLLEVTPITGRTNQIRLHLEYLGHPIIGDPVYSGHLVAAHTLDTESPPLCLHAWKLAIHHPLSGARMEFVSTPPDWAAGGLSGAD
ncbi:MAG: RluA family pseudouridine synthase, partial [Luteolibacter sp.]